MCHVTCEVVRLVREPPRVWSPIAVEAHNPLGHNGETLANQVISQTAAARVKSNAQVILPWQIQHGYIAMPKSVRRERMKDSLRVFDFELPAAGVASLDALDRAGAGCAGPSPDTFDLVL